MDVMLRPLQSGRKQLVLGIIRDMTERKRLEDEMRQLVLTDPLTGFGNYRQLEDVFDMATKWFSEPVGFPRCCCLTLTDSKGLTTHTAT